VICEWTYNTTYGFQFNLQLNMLEMEGSKTKDPVQGCQSSVLRIYSERQTEELCGQQEKVYTSLTNSNWFTLQFISLNRQTKEPLRGFQLTWTVVQIKTKITNNQCLYPNTYFDCKKTANNTNETSFCIHRSLICDGYVHCQSLSNADELPSNCFQTLSSHSRLTSSSFLRQHLILIITVFTLSSVMICIGIILIILIIKTKRRTQGQHVRKEKRNKSTELYLYDNDDNDNDRDLSGVSMMEQAVTTV
jgi:hypothetical protein